ncbi:hypothetical protein, partial [Paenibacillus taichungensis]|uniref:hypothetical protein n=1 Tax=Paenibacillus taichungensis TaxID=484184 RepID=UPI0035DBDBA7
YFVNSLNKNLRGRRFGGRIGLWAAVGSGFLFHSPQQGKSRSKGGRFAPSAPIPPSFAATLALANLKAYCLRYARGAT